MHVCWCGSDPAAGWPGKSVGGMRSTGRRHWARKAERKDQGLGERKDQGLGERSLKQPTAAPLTTGDAECTYPALLRQQGARIERRSRPTRVQSTEQNTQEPSALNNNNTCVQGTQKSWDTRTGNNTHTQKNRKRRGFSHTFNPFDPLRMRTACPPLRTRAALPPPPTAHAHRCPFGSAGAAGRASNRRRCGVLRASPPTVSLHGSSVAWPATRSSFAGHGETPARFGSARDESPAGTLEPVSARRGGVPVLAEQGWGPDRRNLLG
jgi:hypothetical protein